MNRRLISELVGRSHRSDLTRWTLTCIAIATITLSALGCGGEASPSSSASSVTSSDDEAGVRAVVTDYFTGYVAGDAEQACRAQTDHFIARQLREASSGDGITIDARSCAEMVAYASEIMKETVKRKSFTITEVKVDGDRATAISSVDTTYGSGATRYTLVREETSWKIDDESDVGSDGLTEKERAADWVDDWCDVEIGMTRGQVKKIMGKPTDEYDGSGGEVPQSEYNSGAKGFTAFFGDDDRAFQLLHDVKGNPQPDCEATRE